MIKWLQKRLKNDPVLNQRGSTLSMALIVIAVLSFTVTSVTGATITLSGTTQQELFNSNDESIGKGLITQGINDLETFLSNGGTYADFNATEIARLFSTYGLIVEDVTSTYPDFGLINGVESKVYKFSYNLSNGIKLVKLAYVSSSGSNVNTPHPFEFTLGTNGTLILNGGYYEEIDMFGKSIYFSNMAPWYENDVFNEHYVTPAASGTFPDIENNGTSSNIYFTNNYQFCDLGCFTADPSGSTPYVIHLSEYENVEGSSLPEQGNIQADNITDFFTAFIFEDYFVERMTLDLPNLNRTITQTMTLQNYETVLRNNAAPLVYKKNGKTVESYPNTAYYDITNDSNYDFSDDVTLSFSALYDGNLTISGDVTLNDFDNEALVVIGDLTIDNSTNQIQNLKGTFVVTGNLYFTGNEKEFNRSMYLVLGETYINLNDYEPLNTLSEQFAFTVVGNDNIHILSVNESNSNLGVNEFVGFFYTEESIWVDAVNSKLLLKGALYAKAKGETSNPIFLQDEYGTQIHGIVINSFKGYANTSGGTIGYSPSASDSNNRFSIVKIMENRFTKSFLNFPELENVTVNDGFVTIDTSEFRYEE